MVLFTQLVFFLLNMWLLPGPAKPPAGRTLRVEPVFGAAPLVLDSAGYQTGEYEQLTITRLRFYLSDIQLTYTDGRTYNEPASYHLIDADPEATATLRVALPSAPAGALRSFRFSVGVDSAANVAGALGGDLDPGRGMYWAWHSGYVNAKIEGHAPTLATPHHEFSYHVGGFAAPYNSRRTVTLVVPAAAATGRLTLRVDVAQWLAALPLATQPAVMVPGPTAMRVADACARMFSLAAAPVHVSR
ncbi:MbnP family protein [Hymenobacter artigasi]|uniref:Copper-binding protein MbnP-like domain-containing protein n=1 Tax=Hymenobacter artigasi TaxID=2719616 RepID=A0ABX1HRK1_9BACT|nr:MbnP family protein [Hymenobacter artigasi]NKI91957.1 hypothetical protein [Hymenobacter artigasi]